MPKATDSWETSTPPATPLQREAFMEACTQWLVSEPRGEAHDPGDAAFAVPTRAPVAPETACVARDSTTIGRNEEETRSLATVPCDLCGDVSGARAIIVANPFTKGCFVVVCAQCRPS